MVYLGRPLHCVLIWWEFNCCNTVLIEGSFPLDVKFFSQEERKNAGVGKRRYKLVASISNGKRHFLRSLKNHCKKKTDMRMFSKMFIKAIIERSAIMPAIALQFLNFSNSIV